MHMYQCEHADGWGEKWSLIRGTNHDPEKVNVKADGKMHATAYLECNTAASFTPLYYKCLSCSSICPVI